MPKLNVPAASTGAAVLVALPAVVWAAPYTMAAVFQNAAPVPKLIMVGLLGATLAAVIICVLKLASGPRLSGGSAYLSGLRVGGPLAGLLGAAHAGFNMSLGLANAPATPPMNVLARGFAEVVLLIALGLLAGAVAVITNWAVEARIDRAVLRG